MDRSRVLVGAGAVLLVLLVAGVVLVLLHGGGRPGGPDRPAARPSGAPTAGAGAAPAERRALTVLESWDRRRATAYATGSVAPLARLYLPRSLAGAADVRLLQRYRVRHVRVVGMRTQLLSLRVLDRAPGRLRLAVTDRLVGAHGVRGVDGVDGVDGGVAVALPRDAASARVLTLVRTRVGWQVATVRDAGEGVRSGLRRAGR